jgi:hypothetical protein
MNFTNNTISKYNELLISSNNQTNNLIVLVILFFILQIWILIEQNM